LAYYGDDFTGSTDAMEAMTAAGIPAVLFLGCRHRTCSRAFRMRDASASQARRAGAIPTG